MTAPDSTIAARVPLELRRELEELVAAQPGRYKDLGTAIRTACRELVDRDLHGRQNGNPLIGEHPGASRRTDPDTSKAAARDVAPRAGSQRARALAIIAGHGDGGATTDQVIAELELVAAIERHAPPAVNGVARRVTDLLQAGAIQPQTYRDANGVACTSVRPTRHNAWATVYVATEKGRRWLEEASA